MELFIKYPNEVQEELLKGLINKARNTEIGRKYNFSEAMVFGVSSGIGWYLAIMAMAAILQKLKYADLPKGLSGFAINMIITGLIAMTFMAFAGIKLTG